MWGRCMDHTVYGRPLSDVLRGLGWAVAGVGLVVMILSQIAQQVLADLELRPLVATIQLAAGLGWLALCAALAYLAVR